MCKRGCLPVRPAQELPERIRHVAESPSAIARQPLHEGALEGRWRVNDETPPAKERNYLACSDLPRRQNLIRRSRSNQVG